MPKGDNTPPVPSIRLEYPVWDYWDETDSHRSRGTLPMIIFDLDGTLLDSQDLANEGHRRVIEKLGLPPVPQALLEALNGPTSEQAVAMLGLGPERVAEFETHMRIIDHDLIHQQAKLFSGVPDMLKELFGRASLCLLSNGSPHYVQETAQVTGIGRFFDHMQGFVPGITKAQRLESWRQEHRPTRMMMVGDRPTDIEAAHAAGVLSVAVLYGAGKLEELSGAEMIARHVDELRRICLAFCEV